MNTWIGHAIARYWVRVANAVTDVQVGSLRAASATAISLRVTGLTNETAYKFEVRATNVAGGGPYSALSNTVTSN